MGSGKPEPADPPPSRQLTDEELEDLIEDEDLTAHPVHFDSQGGPTPVLVELSPQREDAVKADPSKPSVRATTGFRRTLRGCGECQRSCRLKDQSSGEGRTVSVRAEPEPQGVWGL